jgi:hypothetical protein
MELRIAMVRWQRERVTAPYPRPSITLLAREIPNLLGWHDTWRPGFRLLALKPAGSWQDTPLFPCALFRRFPFTYSRVCLF